MAKKAPSFNEGAFYFFSIDVNRRGALSFSQSFNMQFVSSY